MPCMDDRNDRTVDLERIERVEKLHKEAGRAACALRLLTNAQIARLPKTVQAWWSAHQKEDAEREIQEEVERRLKLVPSRKAVEDAVRREASKRGVKFVNRGFRE